MATKVEAPEKPAPKGTDALEQDIRELAQLSSTPETLVLGDHSYTVGKLTVRKLGPFMATIKNAVPWILQSIAQHQEIRLGVLVESGFTDAIAEGIAVVTGTDPEQIKDMDADHFMVLAAKVLTVNMDFFFHRLPEISGIIGEAVVRAALELKMPSAGAESYSDSSPTGTDSPK